MKIRFRAEWCSSDGPQSEDGFDPDLCEYQCNCFDTQKEADEHAQMMAKTGPAEYWWRVEEQQYVPYQHKGVDIGNWETTATWISGEFIRGDV